MKRFFAFLLSAVMLFSLVSCSSGEGGKKKEEEGEKKDLSQMSGEELYAYGLEKNKALSSALYVTKVIGPEGEFYEIESVRIRSGYDGYSYSRSGNGYYGFLDGKAYVENENGKFSSSATTRSFEEYLAEYVFPLYGLDVKKVENLSRKDGKVFYESKNKTLLSLYEAVPLQGAFTPVALKGEAAFSEEGIMLSEKISIVGKSGEKEGTLLLETTLSDYRSKEIEIRKPENGSFEELQDIRIPQEILAAKKALLDADTFHSTVVASENVNFGEKKFALNRDEHIYYLTSDDGAKSYYSVQTLKQFDKKPEESLFTQILTENGTRTENSYNLITAEKLSENTGEGKASAYGEKIEKNLLAPSDLKNIVKEQTSSGQSFRFELAEGAVERVIKDMIASLAEGGLPAATYQMQEAVGTVSIDKDSGILSSVTYSVSGVCTCDGVEGTFSARFSVLTDLKEGTQIPGLQTPTPTTPGMAVDMVH